MIEERSPVPEAREGSSVIILVGIVLVWALVLLTVVVLLGSGLAPASGPTIVFAYVLILVGIATVPIVWDMHLAYRSRKEVEARHIDKLITSASRDGLTAEELRILVREVTAPPPGIPGLGRLTMALSILVILGIVVFHALAVGVVAGSEDLLKNVMSVLAGAVSAVIGFYFGGKGAEERPEEKPGGARSKEPRGITVKIRANPSEGPAPLGVSFYASVSNGSPPLMVAWDFGDGAKGSGMNPVHVYKEDGTLEVRVEVRDSSGGSASDTSRVRVHSGEA